MALHILQWNACGLIAHYQEFQHLIAIKQYDEICIQETFLKPDKKCCPVGYTCIRQDRTDRLGGGIATFIKNGIKFTELRQPADMECHAVNIRTSAGDIAVVNVYIPPGNHTIPLPLSDLFIHRRNVIILGDMNAKSPLWGSDTYDTRGRALEEAVNAHEYIILNTGQGTHQTKTGLMTAIDVSIVSKQLATKCSWKTLNNTMGSDHVPIVISVSVYPDKQLATVPQWKLAKADWIMFQQILKENLTASNTDQAADKDIDQLNDDFINTIRYAAEQSIPQTKPQFSRRLKPLPYWSEEIKNAICDRNRARNKMKKTKNLEDCINYRRLKDVAQRVIRSTAKQYWQSFCDRLTHSTKLSVVWNMARKMNVVRSNPSTTSLIDREDIIDTDKDKAELFARAFAKISSSSNYSNIFQQHKYNIETYHKELFTNNAPRSSITDDLNKTFTPDELNQAVKKMKRNSATGDDKIAYEFFQHMPPIALVKLLELYNTVWKRGKVPQKWKHAVILPILKMGKDPQKAISYRPISLTSTVSKLMERLVTDRLMWYLEKHNMLNSSQSGFRKGHNTTDHIIRLQDEINKHINNKSHVLAVFIDFEKAFDMVWRTGLLIKLKRFGINGHMFNWIADFTNERSIQVRVGTALSSIYTVENGTAQGSIISPELFLGLIDDLPDCVKDLVHTALFADDSTFYKSGRNVSFLQKKMQSALNAVQAWCDSWGFKISLDKTVAVLYTNSFKVPDIKLELGGQQIKVAKSAKLLGVIFDRRLTWNEHIDYVTTKCSKRLNLMRAISGTNWGATQKSLLTIYRSLIRPLLDYGSLAFDSATSTQLHKLDLIQNAALRISCGAMKGTAASAL